MLEFLEMCGFADCREADLDRLRRAFERLGLGERELRQAKDRLSMYYDLELGGVRKLLGVFLRSVVDTVLARDDGRTKVIHACMAPGMEVVGSAIAGISDKAVLINPNFAFMVILGCVFGRYVPVLEAAERLWLHGGLVSHCGMVKSRLGLLTLDFIPRPDLTVTSGFTCDTSPKTNELIEYFLGVPACYVDTCQDREMSEYPHATRATTLAAASLRAAVRRIEEVAEVGIPDERLWQAIQARESLVAACDRVAQLIANSDPVPLGSPHLNLFYGVGSIPLAGQELVFAEEAVETLYKELSERVRTGRGAVPRGAPRLLAIQPCHHTDPCFEWLVDQAGMVIIGWDFQGTSDMGLSGAGVVDPGDPYEILAQRLHGSSSQPLWGRIAIILDMCRRYRVSGVINHYHGGCRYLAGDAFLIEAAVKKELGLPVLTFPWENFDPRTHDQQEYRTRLETFRSLVDSKSRSITSLPDGG